VFGIIWSAKRQHLVFTDTPSGDINEIQLMGIDFYLEVHIPALEKEFPF